MLKRCCALLFAAVWVAALPLWSQQYCPGVAVAGNTDEDRLTLAVNRTENGQDQLAALDKYVAAHPSSPFLNCANEYYAAIDLKLKDYDKSIDYAEKDLAANYHDLNLYLTVMRAYASSTRVSDTIFAVINNVPEQVKSEIGSVTRPNRITEDDWAKMQKDNAELAKDSHDYAIWAYFQLLPRVTDPARQIALTDTFLQTYPEAAKDNAAQVDSIYFQAYRAQSNLDKTTEFGEKIIAADPNNVNVLNTLGMIYAFYTPHPNVDKASGYAHKALESLPAIKKPDGVDDTAFKKDMDTQTGMAHLTLGYAALANAEKTKRLQPAFDELKTSSGLLDDNPALEGMSLYYLANAYERGTPANHAAAAAALNKAINLPGPFQAQSRTLLAKVKAAK